MFTKPNFTVASLSTYSPVASLVSIAFAALVAVNLAGCAADEATTQQQETPVAAPVTIDEASNGKTVGVAAGQAFMLHLPSNATTGYEWTIVSEGGPFHDPEVSYVPAGEAMGAGGSTRFTWADTKDVAPGRYLVTLDYKRAWEPGAADSFSFTVEISR